MCETTTHYYACGHIKKTENTRPCPSYGRCTYLLDHHSVDGYPQGIVAEYQKEYRENDRICNLQTDRNEFRIRLAQICWGCSTAAAAAVGGGG
jgi:hypothetical protein